MHCYAACHGFSFEVARHRCCTTHLWNENGSTGFWNVSVTFPSFRAPSAFAALRDVSARHCGFPPPDVYSENTYGLGSMRSSFSEQSIVL